MELLVGTRIFNLNQRDSYGRTPLIEASINGSINCVKILIEGGANVNLFNKYQNTPLHVAAVNNHVEIVNILLENRADIMRKNYVSNNLFLFLGK